MSLEEKCDKQKRETGKLTGKISCTLTTLTPMFIPISADSSDFYHYPTKSNQEKDDLFRPIIPGSEIRGAIRSVFEAAFNGCLSQVNEKPFHRRSMDVKKAGLLYKENGKWKLEECERVMLNTTFESVYQKDKQGKMIYHGKHIRKSEIETGKEIYIEKSARKYKNRGFMSYVVENYLFKKKEGYQKGVIYIGEPFGDKKHHESVFIEKKDSRKWGITNTKIDSLIKVIDLYHENYENDKSSKPPNKPYKNYIEKLKGATKNRKIPVYYSEEKNSSIGHLAPAIFSQEVFERTLDSILEKNGGYTPCSCQDNICLACHLFGFVKNKEMQASRIRFSDAESNKEIKQSKSITLPALGTPKPGAVEFYTKKVDSAEYWTYDYKANYDRKKKKGIREKLLLKDIQIRGRKFYWHHELKKEDWKKGVNPSMEAEVRPIEKGNNFTFELYFERLTEDELAQLCNVLDINCSNGYAHKIGRAKPLGFGSIQIGIKDIKTRGIDKTGAFSLEIRKREDLLNYQTLKNSELLEILKFEPQLYRKPVSYPKIKTQKVPKTANDEASHQWFNKNSKNKRKFKDFLPTIVEETSNDTEWAKRKWLKVLKD